MGNAQRQRPPRAPLRGRTAVTDAAASRTMGSLACREEARAPLSDMLSRGGRQRRGSQEETMKTRRRWGVGLLVAGALLGGLLLCPRESEAAGFRLVGTGGGVRIFIKFNSTRKRATWKVVNLTQDTVTFLT